MKKTILLAVLMLSIGAAEAGFFSSLKSKVKKPTLKTQTSNPQQNNPSNPYQEAVNGQGQNGGNGYTNGQQVSAVPLPSALPLAATALGLFGIARRRNITK